MSISNNHSNIEKTWGYCTQTKKHQNNKVLQTETQAGRNKVAAAFNNTLGEIAAGLDEANLDNGAIQFDLPFELIMGKLDLDEGQNLLDRFFQKVDISSLKLDRSDADYLLLMQESPKNLDDLTHIYKTCKYLRYVQTFKELSLCCKKGSEEELQERLATLTPRVIRLLIRAVMIHGNQNWDSALATLEENPRILMEIKDSEGTSVLQQMQRLFDDLATAYKDLSLLRLYADILPENWVARLAVREGLSHRTSAALLSIDDDSEDWAEEAYQLIYDRFVKKQESLWSSENDLAAVHPIFDTSTEQLSLGLPLNEIDSEAIHVTMVGVEYAGFLKQGGLAEALEGMTQAVIQNHPNSKVRLIFPNYSTLPEKVKEAQEPYGKVNHLGVDYDVYRAEHEGVEVLFIDHPAFVLNKKKPNIYGGENPVDRFAIFSAMAAELLGNPELETDVIHLHDWHVAGTGIKMKKDNPEKWEAGEGPAIVFTFHNNNRAAQGRTATGPYNYTPTIQSLKENGISDTNTNLFVEALNMADAVTTVSETFGKEAQTLKLGEGVSFSVRKAAKLGKLIGIVNGTNTTRWNPEQDKTLKEWKDLDTDEIVDLSYGPNSDIVTQRRKAKEQLGAWTDKFMPSGSPNRLNDGNTEFKIDPNKPLVTYVGRFDSYQKGLDQLENAIKATLKNGGQFVVMGSMPDDEANKMLNKLEKKYPKDVLFIRDYKNEKGRYHYQQGDPEEGRPGIGSVVRAASDFVLVPSRFEPCGLVQFESWLFGSQVIASKTGGLVDTVKTPDTNPSKYNGYIFDRDAGFLSGEGLGDTIKKAIKDWKKMDDEELNALSQRLISDGRLYDWTNSPQGLSPALKYRMVYQLGKQRKIKRKTSSDLPGTFDIRDYLYIRDDGSSWWSGNALKKEEAYLHAFHYTNIEKAELESQYKQLSADMRQQLPAPYGRGVNFTRYNEEGAFVEEGGTRFRVRAPNAADVTAVIFDENEDIVGTCYLVQGDDGYWEGIDQHVAEGDYYQLMVDGATKIDPYGLQHVPSKEPGSPPFSVVSKRDSFEWNDVEWVQKRKRDAGKPAPMSIFEVYPAAWKKEEGKPLNYRDLAVKLAEHCEDAGFTHVELMGILEHPCDESMGYQVTGFFAPTSRHGSVDDFKFMINYLHEKGIAVILDWVPAHFAKDEYALRKFDGTTQFEPEVLEGKGKYLSPRWIGFHHWDTFFFDYSQKEVREFLISSAMYWIQEMHIDSLRVDAVSCMLNSEDASVSELITLNAKRLAEKIHFGSSGAAALNRLIEPSSSARLFLQDLNAIIHTKGQGATTIAEDFTGDGSVTGPAFLNGLGFDMKWNVGWMHGTLDYFSKKPEDRAKAYSKLKNAVDGDTHHKMVMALSHDEVKKGMKSLLNKAPNLDDHQRYANLKMMLCFMMGVPGKKLNFMGNEFAAEQEWTDFLGQGDKGVSDVEVTEQGKIVFQMLSELNHLYQTTQALWEKDENGLNVEWIIDDDEEGDFLGFRRSASTKESVSLLYNLSFDANSEIEVSLSLDEDGYYLNEDRSFEVMFNSDSEAFGGNGAEPEIEEVQGLVGYLLKFEDGKEILAPIPRDEDGEPVVGDDDILDMILQSDNELLKGHGEIEQMDASYGLVGYKLTVPPMTTVMVKELID